MTYKLIVTETKNKAGKFHYTVVDETGNVISQRRSNREYVACTIYGSFYFGRLDLVGKGDHGTRLKYESGFRRDYDKKGGPWIYDPAIPKQEHEPIAYKS